MPTNDVNGPAPHLGGPPRSVPPPRGARGRGGHELNRAALPATAFGPEPRRRSGFLRFRIRPEGLIFLALFALVTGAAYNTGANLLYLVMSMQIAIMFLAVVLGGRNLSGLKVNWESGLREINAGEPGRLTFLLENTKRRGPSTSIRVASRARGRREETIDAAGACWGVEAGQSCAVRLSVHPRERGWHELESLSLTSSYPFGILERTVRIRAPHQFLVLPRALTAQDIQKRLKGFEGDMERGQRGHGSNISGIRDYVLDDPAHLIHWKHSARGLGIKIKEFEDEASRRCCLALDLRAPLHADWMWLEALEHGIRVAAGCAQLLLQQGFQVALWTTEGGVGPGMTRTHAAPVLRFLAQLETQAPDAIFAPPDFDARNWPALQIEYVDAASRQGVGGVPMSRFFSGGGWQIFDAREVPDPWAGKG